MGRAGYQSFAERVDSLQAKLGVGPYRGTGPTAPPEPVERVDKRRGLRLLARRMRVERGWTFQRIADELGVSVTTAHRWGK